MSTTMATETATSALVETSTTPMTPTSGTTTGAGAGTAATSRPQTDSGAERMDVRGKMVAGFVAVVAMVGLVV